MSQTTELNSGWQFHLGDDAELTRTARPGQAVRLPHNAADLPFNYLDEAAFQQPFTYQRVITADPSWDGQEVALRFDAVMADARVFLNGERIAAHRDGYTPFHARLTGRLRQGENLLTVVLDGAENPTIPPFGGQIDYLTYAGIYRDVWLEVAAPVSISSVKVETPDVLADTKTAQTQVTLSNPRDLPLEGDLTATLRDSSGAEIAIATVPVTGAELTVELANLKGIDLWQPSNPALYTLELNLTTPAGEDTSRTTFGFRSVEFTTDGFFLNGEHLKLRGLNRHQSFPYVGYAMPRAAQERDAEIVRFDLGCNVVRSSHYPASPWFLDHCDRIGLLVLEEIPGWQHIGGAEWKAESVRNVERMIRRDWNHPSIITWGVRINESPDDHDFYTETNSVARALDQTRPTSGIRCITDSEFLEDIYTMNDFVLGDFELGGNRSRRSLRPQREVTGLNRDVPYMVTEFNGHMFPTKSFDTELRQDEHVRRHLEVLDAAYGDTSSAGAIGWCAFDYNTHSDFGSGDGICYHGVMDMFREPKYAGHVYASQVDPSERVVLEPVTLWSRGERNIGGVLPLTVLTNCDEIELHYAELPPRRIGPDRRTYPNLPHPPVIIDREHFSEDELSEWGEKWFSTTIIGLVDGKEIARVELPAKKIPTELEVVADRQTLAPVGDCIRVIVRALDQVGRKMPYFAEPVEVTVAGAARLIGPSLLPLRGGSTGFWIESADETGPVTLTVTNSRLGEKVIMLLAEENT